MLHSRALGILTLESSISRCFWPSRNGLGAESMRHHGRAHPLTHEPWKDPALGTTVPSREEHRLSAEQILAGNPCPLRQAPRNYPGSPRPDPPRVPTGGKDEIEHQRSCWRRLQIIRYYTRFPRPCLACPHPILDATTRPPPLPPSRARAPVSIITLWPVRFTLQEARD